MEQARDLANRLRPEITSDYISAERQRQPARALGPPFAHIDNLLQPFILIRELPLVNQQAGADLPSAYGVLNTAERHHDVVDVRAIDPQREKRRRQRPRDGDRDALHGRGAVGSSDDDRAVVVSHTGTMREQQIGVRQVRVGVERDRADLVLSIERGTVQRFDIGEMVAEFDSVPRNFAAGKSVMHERIIGIRAVGDGDLHCFLDRSASQRSSVLKSAAGARYSFGVICSSISLCVGAPYGTGPYTRLSSGPEDHKRRRLAVDVDQVAEVQAVAFFTDGGLAQLALNPVKIQC